MKVKTLLLSLVTILIAGCSTNDWIDWKTQNEIWLQQNKIAGANDSTFHVTSSGLQYRIIADPNPTDVQPYNNSTISCDYTGKLINGAQFDKGTSNETSISLSSAISGFVEGVKKIHQNGDIELYIPYDLGYGEDGSGTEGTSSYIPPYSTLIFTIHLSTVQ